MAKWQAALRLVGVGWFIGLSILLGILGGYWLDGKFGTKPIITIVGLVLGMVVAFYGLYRMLLPIIRNRDGRNN